MSSAWVTRLECPKGVKGDVKQARRAKRVAEGHQLEIGAQRAPRFLVFFIILKQDNDNGNNNDDDDGNNNNNLAYVSNNSISTQ